jgi:hypothetical protein
MDKGAEIHEAIEVGICETTMLRSLLLGRRLASISNSVSSTRIINSSNDSLLLQPPRSSCCSFPTSSSILIGTTARRWFARKGVTKPAGQGKKAHINRIKSMRKLNIQHRYTLILKACDELFKHYIEDPRKQKITITPDGKSSVSVRWHQIERLIYHKKFRGWTKLRTIVGAFIYSKKRYLLKDDGHKIYFTINLQHPRYVKQREEAIKNNPSLTSNVPERYRLRTEKQTESLHDVVATRNKHKGTSIPPLVGGKPSNDPFKRQ